MTTKPKSRPFGPTSVLHGFTPPAPELAAGAHATERFLARAAELIRHGDVARAAQFLRVPEKTLERWYHACVERQHDTTPAAPIARIGIDELSLKNLRGLLVGRRGESPLAPPYILCKLQIGQSRNGPSYPELPYGVGGDSADFTDCPMDAVSVQPIVRLARRVVAGLRVIP